MSACDQAAGAAVQVRRCRSCGCTDDDCSGCIRRTGVPCWWVTPDRDLCSACAGRGAELAMLGGRTLRLLARMWNVAGADIGGRERIEEAIAAVMGAFDPPENGPMDLLEEMSELAAPGDLVLQQRFLDAVIQVNESELPERPLRWVAGQTAQA